ncbi:hypothetical protein EU537_04470 [Candidatus Thorarchaeota archaeon]|nr:MAG: hypothetical protein EU537_04470 [Candidatus Thorarchaeota archaeon]
MNQEAGIKDAIYWRDYGLLDNLVDDELAEWGWPCLRKILLSKTGDLPASRLRDGLLHILGLDTVRGIEIDPLEWIRQKEVAGDKASELKRIGSEKALEVLENMISVRNTFFLDVKEMALGPFVLLTKSVLNARKEEIDDLKSPVSIWDAVQTAYGYYVFSSGGVLTSRRSPDHKSLREVMSDVAGNIGCDLEIDSSPLQLGGSISGFKNCSKRTRELLWHLLKLKTYKGKQTVRKSAAFLEKHAHSVVAPYLHEFLSQTKYYYTAVKIFRVLGAIGLEESLDVLLPFVSKGRNWGASALKAMSTLAGESVTTRLSEMCVSNTHYSRYRILRYIRTRPSIEILNNVDLLKQGIDGWHLRRVEQMENRARNAIGQMV